MPTYDYRCRDCGHILEIMHSILEDGPDACERCRGPVDRVVQPTGLIFRGSGFYVTDSRSGGSTSEASGGDGGEDSTDDSKAAPKHSAPKATDAKGSKESSGSSGGSSGSGRSD